MFGFGLTELLVVLVLLLFIATPVFWVWALVEIIRDDFPENGKVIWLLLVILLPILGVILYFAIGRRQRIIAGGAARFCTACGGALNGAASCPQCGTQVIAPAGKMSGGAIAAIVVTVALFFFIFVGGILAAIAIPQFAAYRMKAFNATANAELRNVKTSMESYYIDHQLYPESLEQAGYTVMAKDVEVEIIKLEDGRYAVHSYHNKGDREYLTFTVGQEVYSKPKSAPNDAYELQ
jgi:type II secretory pathway pseudopilin PulG